MATKKLKIAALGDLHIDEESHGQHNELLNQIGSEADILLLCGDLTSHGNIREAEILTEKLAFLKIPVVSVFGNHDFEQNHQDAMKQILRQKGIHLLDGDSFIFENVGFAGVKGFSGGFDNHMLPSWGEEINKRYVLEAVNEALKLETTLSRLQTEKKVVLMHYSPIKQTVEGEPLQIWPFLGSSRLEDPLERYKPDVVFHGHAHLGTHQGQTKNLIPVYNVSLPLLQNLNPKKPFFLFEL